MAQGSLDDILNSKRSVTADYLNGTREVPVPATRRKSLHDPERLRGVTAEHILEFAAHYLQPTSQISLLYVPRDGNALGAS